MTNNSIGRRVAHAEIKLLLDYSYQIYQKYLQSNKQFLYASVLRKVNAKLYEALLDSIVHLKDETHADALEFMLHLDVWMAIWDVECIEKKPQLWDTFTFQNEINFPQRNVHRLLMDLAQSED
jgi:hypothetical protein